MKVIVTGLPLFSKRLVDDLNQISGKNQFVFLDTYNSKWAQLKCLLLLPFVSGIFSMNGVSDHSGILNWVIRRRKKLWMQWVGTDVTIAKERIANQTINRKYIDYAQHATDAIWLQEELSEVGIHCVLNKYKYLPTDFEPVEKYTQIEVCSYVPQERQSFYGLPEIIQLAMAHPSIPFHIYGMTTPEREAPQNVIFYGWQTVEIVQEKMKESAIFLRLTEHDGFSVSVVEAFSLGCEVVTTQPFPFACDAREHSLHDAFQQAIGKVSERGMKPQLDALKYYRENFKKEKVFLDLYNQLNEFFGK